MSMMNETNESLVNEAEGFPAEEAADPAELSPAAPEADTVLSGEETESPAAEPQQHDEVPAASESPVAEDSAEPQPAEPGQKSAGEQEEKAVSFEMPSMELLEKELKKSRYRSNYSRVLRSTFFSLLVVAAVAVIIAVLLMPVMQITGISMTPTLDDGDLVIALNNGKFQTGDVIGFYFNNGILIKRVIATTGDWVDIDSEGSVYVNGVMLYEPYVSEKSIGECNITLPYQVPEGKCFVMGDHRSTSIDSRNTAVGCISNDVVVGKLLLRIWPLSVFGGVS